MTKEIKLTKGKVALVDDDMFEYLSQWKWCYNGNGYAVRQMRLGFSKQRKVYMHRQIIEIPDGLEIDHIDGNGLNNQKSNLRTCTSGQNKANRAKYVKNTSGFKGVSWDKRDHFWVAQITVNRKMIHLRGKFSSAEEAARAYDEAARKYFGEFAQTNF